MLSSQCVNNLLFEFCISFLFSAVWVLACVAGRSGCERETFCGESGISASVEAASEVQLDSSPFFSRPAQLFALAFGIEVRAGTHSRRLRRLSGFEPWLGTLYCDTLHFTLYCDTLLSQRLSSLRYINR